VLALRSAGGYEVVRAGPTEHLGERPADDPT